MPEQVPSFDLSLVDEAQRSSVESVIREFSEVAISFSEEEIVAAFAVTSEIPDNYAAILPLTRDPQTIAPLLLVCSKVNRARVYKSKVFFDEDTEQDAGNNPSVIPIRRERDTGDRPALQEALFRWRLATYVGRLARLGAVEEGDSGFTEGARPA